MFFFFQAEDGIRDLVRSRGLGDVYKRQLPERDERFAALRDSQGPTGPGRLLARDRARSTDPCLLYTSDAADDLLCVDLGGRRIIKKKKQ